MYGHCMVCGGPHNQSRGICLHCEFEGYVEDRDSLRGYRRKGFACPCRLAHIGLHEDGCIRKYLKPD